MLGVPLKKEQTFEDWLHIHNDSCFPEYSTERGEFSYSKRYEDLKTVLSPIHNSVNTGALATGALDWMKKATQIIKSSYRADKRNRLLMELNEADPVVHLNNHGKDHVDRVIEKVAEIVRFFERDHVTPYEGFLILCAIQIHDIGNVFGRMDHEKTCREILETKCNNIIPDAFERRTIEKLALVHGGAFGDNRDTISHLYEPRILFNQKIRKRLLAALLRFGDELADDSTRADRDGLKQGTILEGSRIYHRYSEALHTVKIEKDKNEKLFINLSFELDTSQDDNNPSRIIYPMKKNGKDKFLLDEIYDRTLKMERERRYCIRFLRRYISWKTEHSPDFPHYSKLK